jgi:putative membrane-bound dehydrogenase-like protein
MMAGLDERGRLFIAESAGRNIDFKKLAADPPNFIRMIEDTDGDGTFDRSTIFADRMTFPTGALWHDGALYVCSPPGLWKLEDTNDDGVCDRRTEIVTGFGSIGNGADLHGPFLGPDGWLYFCDGRNGHDVTLGDGTRWKGLAAAVYRCRTDGSGLEVVFGGGFDNPVEAVFTPQGEFLVTCNLVMAQPQRLDGILYGIDGGVYPYAACVSEFKRTGELLKPVGDLGWVAPSGMLRYDGTAMGRDFDGNLFTTQFDRHRVQRHIVTRDGAGFRIASQDFLTSGDVDFHPTDVLQDADGSLLLIDTGGWFRIGCPQSQVEKPSILGGIYRIRRTGAARVEDPRGLKLNRNDASGAELISRLDDARPAVVKRAVDALVKTDAAAAELEELAVHHHGASANLAVWSLSRRNTPSARAAVRRAIENPDGDVRRTAIRAAGLARDKSAAAALLQCLPSKDLAESREAALALAHTGDPSATAALLVELKRTSDRFHEHAIIHALISIADRPGVAAGLADRSPAVRRGAMIALDQMRDGNLTADEIIPLLGADDAAARQEAMTIVTARPQWAGKVAEQLRLALAKPGRLDEQEQRGLGGMITAFASDAGVQGVVTETLGTAATPAATRLLLLDAIAAAPLDALPARWRDAIGSALRDNDAAVVRQAIEAVRTRAMNDFDADLARIARDPAHSAELRIAALAAAAPRIKPDDDTFALLLAQLDKDQSLLARLSAAQCLARLSLNDAQLTALATTALPSAGPMETQQLLPRSRSRRAATPSARRWSRRCGSRSPRPASPPPCCERRSRNSPPTSCAPLSHCSSSSTPASNARRRGWRSSNRC